MRKEPLNQKYLPLSVSSLKQFMRSPQHFLLYKEGQQEETAAMRFGTAVHCALLEPAKFPKEYTYTDLRKNTKAYKEWLAEQREGIKVLTQGEIVSIRDMATSVQQHPMARHLMKVPEKEVMLTGELYGVPFRGILDGLGDGVVMDLKTCQDSSPDEFSRSAYNFKYYAQLAAYRMLAKQNGHDIHSCYIVAVESKAPYSVAVYQVPEYYLIMGEQWLENAVGLFKEWDGISLGYDYLLSTKSMELHPPAWAQKKLTE